MPKPPPGIYLASAKLRSLIVPLQDLDTYGKIELGTGDISPGVGGLNNHRLALDGSARER